MFGAPGALGARADLLQTESTILLLTPELFREHETGYCTCNESFEIAEMAMMLWHLKAKTFAL